MCCGLHAGLFRGLLLRGDPFVGARHLDRYIRNPKVQGFIVSLAAVLS